MAVSYDTLELQISADVSNASKGIKTLTKNLSNLQNVVKGEDFALIEQLQEHLQNIANIDFSNVSQGLRDVVSAFKQVNSAQSKFNEKKPIDNTKAINLMTGFGQGFKEPELPKIEFEESIVSKLWEGSSAIQSLNGEVLPLNYNLDELKQRIYDVAVDSDSAIGSIRKLGKETSKAGSEAQKGASGFTKLASAFKRVLFYRIVRRIIQLIAQAIKEGIQNIAQFSESFNEAMSGIKSSLSYLKNSIGSAFAPLIEMVAPIVSEFVDLFAEAFNKIGETMAIISGKDTFNKATKGVENYYESLKKVKSQTLGIDELNVLKKDDGLNFEEVKVGESEANKGLKELGNLIREILSAIVRVVSIILDVVGRIIKAISPVFKPLFKIINWILDAFEKLLKAYMPLIEKILTACMNLVAQILVLVLGVLNAVEPFIAILTDELSGAFAFIFDVVADVLWVIQKIVKVAGNVLVPIVQALVGAISVILAVITTVFEVFNGIYRTIKEVIDFMFNWNPADIGRVWQDVARAIGEAWGHVGNVFSTIGETGVEYVENSNIDQYAVGGFPEDGLFFANHNELIGQFSNGQTVVANNEQIVEGIKQGVYEAMMMSQGGNDNGGVQIAVYLDSTEIAKRVQERNIARKDNNIVGAYKYGS